MVRKLLSVMCRVRASGLYAFLGSQSPIGENWRTKAQRLLTKECN